MVTFQCPKMKNSQKKKKKKKCNPRKPKLLRKSSSRIITNVWLHHWGFDEAPGEKTWWWVYKDAERK